MTSVRPSRIAQVAIPIHDLERAKAFYGERLGLTHLFDAPPGLSFFQCGETRLMLSQPEGPETAGSSILYYAVESAREAQALLQWAFIEDAVSRIDCGNLREEIEHLIAAQLHDVSSLDGLLKRP